MSHTYKRNDRFHSKKHGKSFVKDKPWKKPNKNDFDDWNTYKCGHDINNIDRDDDVV